MTSTLAIEASGPVGGEAGDVALVLGEAAALTAVFAPLTVRLYRPG